MALKPASNEPLDLDVDLSQVDPSMPVLPGALYDLRVHDVNRVENSRKDGFNLEVILATTEDTVSIQGQEIKAGFPLKMWCPLQSKADATDKEGWKKNIAMLVDATTGSSTGNRPKFTKDLVLNKIVRANVKVEDYEGRPTNKIGVLTHPE